MRHALYYIIAISALALTGCGSSEPLDNIVMAEAPRMFNHVTLTGEESGRIYDDAAYYVVFDDDSRTCTITMSNLMYPGSESPQTLVFENVAWNYPVRQYDMRRIIDAETLVSEGVDSGVTISNLHLVYIQSNELASRQCDGIYVAFDIDGYHVTTYPYQLFAQGTTVVTAQSDTDGRTRETVDYDVTYSISLIPKANKAAIMIEQLDINGDSERYELGHLDMRLTETGYEISSEGDIRASDRAVIGNFSGNADMLDELKVAFEITVNGVDYTVQSYLTPAYIKH